MTGEGGGGPVRLFVYGTLRQPARVRDLLGRVPEAVPACAPGWRAAPLTDRWYPGLVADAGSSAAGEVLELDARELEALDRYEGPEYDRRTIAVRLASGDEATVLAYVWRSEHAGAVRAGVWRCAT